MNIRSAGTTKGKKMNTIAAIDLTAGQTFSTKYDKLTALEAPKFDSLDSKGGYKALVRDASGEEFIHLFGANEMVKVAA
jgi:hypothetical protein